MEGRRWLLRQLLISALAVTGHAANSSAGEFIRQPSKSVKPAETVTSKTGAALPVVASEGTSQAEAGWIPIEPRNEGSSPSVASGLNWLPREIPKSRSGESVSRPQLPASKTPSESSPSAPLPNAQIKSATSVDLDERDRDSLPAFLKLGIPEVPANAADRTPFDTGMDLEVPVRAQMAAMPTQADSRQQLANKISNELVSYGTVTSAVSAPVTVSALGPGPGWQAVGEQLTERVAKCETLLERRAYLSAKQEIEEGIVYLVRILDHRQNRVFCETAWAEAQQAMLEAEEFLSKERIANDSDMFVRLIQSHETPVLHGIDVSVLTPIAAAQHYRAYAEQKLVAASLGHPWFSELYYCLGRAYQAQADAGKSPNPELFESSLTFYKAAFTIQPENAVNANQLGYVLLRMDRPAEAFNQLIEVVRMPNCPLAAWQNVIEASNRLGNQRTAQWALQNYLVRKDQPQAIDGPAGTLLEVNPQQFAAMSPYSSGPRVPAQESQPVAAEAVESSKNANGRAKSASALRSGLFR